MNFDGKNLTGNSRLIPIAEFAEKLKVEDILRSDGGSSIINLLSADHQ